MIVHIFRGETYHLSPSLSKGFLTAYRDVDDPIMIIYGKQGFESERYIKLFQECDFRDYHICTSYLAFLKLLHKYRKQPILFHAGSYNWFYGGVLMGCRKLNWVCWGSGAGIRNAGKSKVFAPIKRFLYNRFKSIVTLMEDDRETICHDYTYPLSSIYTIPYQTAKPGKYPSDIICWELMHSMGNNIEKPIVMLGNNTHQIARYMGMLPRLHQYKGRIKVWCMMNYSLEKNERYYQFILLGKELFGDDFESREEFYDNNDDLLHFMNKCNVYVCDCPNQTGLGAIGNCLRLGKKVYISGKNYHWMTKTYGVKVFHTDEINESLVFEDFITPLSMKEQEENYNKIIGQREANYMRWQEYLKMLSHQ